MSKKLTFVKTQTSPKIYFMSIVFFLHFFGSSMIITFKQGSQISIIIKCGIYVTE